MAIVCFSASQLKPDVGYPSQLKGESNSHPLAGLRACCSPLPLCTVPRWFVDLLICSVLSWKVINSSGTPAFVPCLQTFCFFGVFTLQTELPETKPTYSARSNRTAGKLQQARSEQSDGRKEVRGTNTLVKCSVLFWKLMDCWSIPSLNLSDSRPHTIIYSQRVFESSVHILFCCLQSDFWEAAGEMAPYQSPELTAACQARAGPPAICSQPQPELEREGASMQLWLGSQLLFGEAHTLSRALYLGKVLQCKRLIKLSNLLFVASLLWWQAMTCGNLRFWGNRGYFLVMGCSCIILREKLNPQWWFCHFLESNPCPFETSLLLICAWWM